MGLMGAGKTTVGRAVAARLGWPFHDSDEEIRQATGLTARDLLARDGVDVLHRLEATILLARLAQGDSSVIAAAASTVEDAGCRQALRRPAVLVMWLRARPAILAARVTMGGRHRPRYGPDPALSLAEQAARREPLLAALRPLVLDVDGTAVEDLAAAAVAAVRDRWPSAP